MLAEKNHLNALENHMNALENHLNALENHMSAFHVRKLPAWLTDHGPLLTVPFVLCLILCALSSLALITLMYLANPEQS